MTAGLGRRGRWAIPALGLIALLITTLAPPRAVHAHPLDVYLQATYLTLSPSRVAVELDLSPGVLVAPEILPALDPDGDQQISDPEGRAYVDAVLAAVVLQVDGEPLALTVSRVDLPTYLVVQAGYGTIRVFAEAAVADAGTGAHRIAYANGYAPTGSAYQVNAFVEQGTAVTLGKQNRDGTQRSMTMDYAVGAATAGTEGTGDAAPAVRADGLGRGRRLLAYFDTPSLSPGKLLLALGIAALLGGLHALTPGHGKTLVAAYLVGSRGTVRHAALLGAIVTFTHTASVVAIGLLALFASRWILPDVLVPTLQVLSGALVVVMGTRLIWQRWTTLRRGKAVAVATHGHGGAGGLVHDHGDGRVHAHLPPAAGVSPGSLVAMGVSGGLVPCPEALGIMIVAVGLNRIGLGLGLIVSFSVGLAAVLIGIGILLVRFRSLVERFGRADGRWATSLPLGSAVIVTALGVGITLRGVAAYLR